MPMRICRLSDSDEAAHGVPEMPESCRGVLRGSS